MATITYLLTDGGARHVDVPNGFSVMEGAVTNGVPGIVADCGGNMACATCHVYVNEDWRDRLPPPSDMEEAMLEFAAEPRENSRLSCQIKVDESLDGLVVAMPESQA